MSLLNPKISSPFPFPHSLHSPPQSKFHKLFPSQPLNLPTAATTKLYSLSPLQQEPDYLLLQNEDRVIGDCLVFEEGVFEDPYLENDNVPPPRKPRRSRGKQNVVQVEAENLVPDKWKQVQEELNLTKKEKRQIALQIEFGSRVEKKKQGYLPLNSLDLKEYLAYKEAKLSQLNPPLVLDKPSTFPTDAKESEEDRDCGFQDFVNSSSSTCTQRVPPKNPKWAVYGRGLDDVSEFFNSGNYDPPDKKSDGPRRKLFTKEEKVLLNKKLPHLATATSKKWLPLHSLAASGEFYFVDALLKHNVDINAVDKDGLTALHKAIIGKKQAVTNYLLRESANPFVVDEDGATLLHYAVQTASSPAIKILLLYNVDINLQDNDGWTPLHLAVQARRTDIVKLLLIKGADKTLKNRDGLTPLDVCLYSGRDTRTFGMIKLLKQLPTSK
ncbi:ankyrin repeat domain-containing protein [Citrus sinensis]|uniref:Ankyrin repeat domain-containing protein n=1 Tax=Citrus sinensis TaxID=2711 RepID=A0ACB8J1C7_CITSI|nr:ankyrin repeat domain-containing protein [Citrus sinensis]